jgi:hypothetical protein
MPDKPLIWLGSSRRDIRTFPTLARQLAGLQLRRVQQGLDPDDWKPMQTVGPGVREIRIQSLVHTECSTWLRKRRRSTSFTRSRRRRRSQAHTSYGSAATGSVL